MLWVRYIYLIFILRIDTLGIVPTCSMLQLRVECYINIVFAIYQTGVAKYSMCKMVRKQLYRLDKHTYLIFIFTFLRFVNI